MIVVRDDRVGCSAHMNRKTCQNNRSIRLAEIEARSFDISDDLEKILGLLWAMTFGEVEY